MLMMCNAFLVIWGTMWNTLLVFFGEVWEKVWMDVFAGRTLVVAAQHPGLEEQQAVVLPSGELERRPGVFSVPVNAVKKMEVDRTESKDIRVVDDLRGPNKDGDPRNHLPALSPRPREGVRGTAWWRRRDPGIPIVFIKQDVQDAFKTMWLMVADMGRHATDLPEPKSGEVPATIEEARRWKTNPQEFGLPLRVVKGSRPPIAEPSAG